MSEREIREQICLHGSMLFERGYTCGSSGNISVRLPDGILITPTNSCLGRLDPERISKVDWNGELIEGDKPSKEAFLHLAMYRSRPNDQAVVHLHSTHSVAVSCLADVNSQDVLPAVTAYYVMRVGRLPMVPYFPPGDHELAAQVEAVAYQAKAMLLANHGPIVAGKELSDAVYAAEELEETAKIFLLLRNDKTRCLTDKQRDDLQERYRN